MSEKKNRSRLIALSLLLIVALSAYLRLLGIIWGLESGYDHYLNFQPDEYVSIRGMLPTNLLSGKLQAPHAYFEGTFNYYLWALPEMLYELCGGARAGVGRNMPAGHFKFVLLSGKKLRRPAVILLGTAAICVFAVNVHNTSDYLLHFRSNPHYDARWSPEIYSLSHYVNEQGPAFRSIISVDWGLYNQIYALGPKNLRKHMRDYRPIFRELGKKTQQEQSTTLNYVFPEGKSLVLTFAASKETFPETRRNFLASMAAFPKLKSRLLKKFQYGNEEIYEVYEIVRPSDCAL
ncbi:MAG TPA: hypothetical protein VN957_19930 [Chthoniobacterales bacterium]|nr:hypothetical protein [Chthoniobacterales bacterium]